MKIGLRKKILNTIINLFKYTDNPNGVFFENFQLNINYWEFSLLAIYGPT
jgi:hypothetical protein